MAYAAVAQAARDVQNGQIRGGEQPLGGFHFRPGEVGHHRFPGVLPKVADDHRWGIAGQAVDVRSLTGDVLGGVDPPEDLTQPLRRAGPDAGALLFQNDQGVNEHLTDNHGNVGLRRTVLPEQIDLPGTLLELGKVIILQQELPLGDLENILQLCADGGAELLQLFPGHRQVDVDAPPAGQGCKLVPVLGADQTKGLFSQLLTGSVEDVVGPAGGDNKKFIVIVVVEGGVGGVPPVKGHSLGKEPRIVVIVYSCFSL